MKPNQQFSTKDSHRRLQENEKFEAVEVLIQFCLLDAKSVGGVFDPVEQ